MSEETYDIFAIEAEDGSFVYTDDDLGTVNGFINLGLDCDVYHTESVLPLDAYTDTELNELEFEFVASYHA